MPLQLNRPFRPKKASGSNSARASKVPAGPLGLSMSKSKNKKGNAGAKAGLGRAGRKPPGTKGNDVRGGPTPAGPGQSLNPNQTVRLPNRGGAPAAPKKGSFFGRFFKRGRTP